jgi:hypothetical protein
MKPVSYERSVRRAKSRSIGRPFFERDTFLLCEY